MSWTFLCTRYEFRPGTPPAESPEDAARKARYAALAQTAASLGLQSVLLGHHADDQAETLLLALSRGAGLPGLAAMPECFERHGMSFRRPLLGIAAKSLREWLAAQGVAFIDDPTNADTAFTRNRIRHAILPALETAFPQFRETFARSARHAAQAQELLVELAASDLSLVGNPPVMAELRRLSRGRQANLLRHWLRTACDAAASTAQMEELLDQVEACATRGHAIRIEDRRRPGGTAPGGVEVRHVDARSSGRRLGPPAAVIYNRHVSRGAARLEHFNNAAAHFSFPMALIVHKYGGTSMGSTERIRNVAKRVAKWYRAGHQMVVVPSAMSGETNRLLALAKELAPSRQTDALCRELDMLASTGEQVSVGLLAIALQAEGLEAVSYAGWQVPIRTNSAYTKARITSIDDRKVRADLAAGRVVIITGFQGLDEQGNITTLGRGGSDTSAVAVAAAMKADECLIYTDVDGVYTTDPRVVPEARRLHTVSFEEMLEMASLGSKVLQIRSVEFAGKYRVPLRVLSSFTPWDIDIEQEARSGTLITYEEDEKMEQAIVSGIAFNRDEAKISILGVPDKPGIAYNILGAVADANIEVDMIIQNISKDGKTDFSFTVNRNDYARAMDLLKTKVLPASGHGNPGGRHQDLQGQHRRDRHAQPCRHRQQDVPRAERGGDQHPDDLHQRNQDIGGDRREVHGAGRAGAAPCFRPGPAALLKSCNWGIIHALRKRDRVAEGAPLLREYGV